MNPEPPESFSEMMESLLAESDRGSVLVAAAYLEDSLELLLRSWFSAEKTCIKKAVDPLFSGMGAISTFSAKIKVTYALQLIDDQAFGELETVRKIRNKFAHSHTPASFDAQDVMNQTNALDKSGLLNDVEIPENGYNSVEFPYSKTRVRFTLVASKLIGAINAMADAQNDDAE